MSASLMRGGRSLGEVLKVGVFGAGAVGTYLGVTLSSQGLAVTMVGRQWLVERAAALEARSISGAVRRPGDDLVVTTDPGALADVDVCLVTVKTRHSAEAARTLAGVLPEGVAVCSFQNGLRNPRILAEHGLGAVLPGMVGFNVFERSGCFVQATSGPLALDGGSRPAVTGALVRAFESAGEVFQARPDLQAVQAGKLLLNLNNAMCALTGLSIRDSLRSRPLRRAFAASIREGLEVFRAAGIPTARVGKLPAWMVSRLLPLPDAIFLRAAPALIEIDPEARSSTLQDLEAGKPTEIDALSGEIVALAADHGVRAPINAWALEEIHRLESAGLPIPFLTPREVWAQASALV